MRFLASCKSRPGFKSNNRHGDTDPSAAAHADRVVFLADGKIVEELVAPSADLIFDTMKGLGD
ncbi:MAG: hypothetical protein Ct9H300mP26_4480 [Acidimicrobiales bacterium]|nr:MAG: hypothetical protein Ct9H300mP26_4480 [Acidimicrobiales bacterium]